jgi:phosphoribosyl 1,2-cyclic phosphate phosphodiesterase
MTPLVLTFLGTGTSMGVPVAGGFGSDRPTGDPRDERYRTSAWIRSETTNIVIDIGPEFRLQSLRSGIRLIDTVLITHEHTDHIGGLDDLRSYMYATGVPVPVMAHPRTAADIRTRFHYMFEPGKTPGSLDIDFLPVKPCRIGDIDITPIPVTHGEMEILAYRLNDIVYVTDANAVDEHALSMMADADILVLNALRWKPAHPTHFTVPEAVDMARRVGAKRTYFVHMSTAVRHADVQSRLPAGMMLAYDQLEVISGRRTPTP